MSSELVRPEFYSRNPRLVARDLIGKRLVRQYGANRLGGRIIETEAYLGRGDTASHADRGVTPRTKPLFGRSGHAYVYLIYGLHHMLNIVAGTSKQGGQTGPFAIRAEEVRKLPNTGGR